MRVILVDDEPIALEMLELMLSVHDDIQVVGSFTQPFHALKEIEKLQPDVIFLDIEMGEFNGIEISERFLEQNSTIKIVFITAFSQYAIDAFEINAIDYLLKPIQEKRLSKTIKRLKDEVNNQKIQSKVKHLLHNELKIKSFGSFQVYDSKDLSIHWRTKKTKELFAYLWEQNGKAISKMKIMETIFPDKDLEKATTLLHTTIYQLRKSLEKLGYLDGIVYINESYKLKLPINSDIKELNDILMIKSHNEEHIIKILRIYKGDFLEEEGYHWVIETQQKYKERVFNILEKYGCSQLEEENLSHLLKNCLEQMHKMEPFNEDIVKMIIQFYGKQCKKVNLEDFFTYYKDFLWTEMNMKPMDNTTKLYMFYMRGCY